jgi:WD40-like Beta Propeller Repeat
VAVISGASYHQRVAVDGCGCGRSKCRGPHRAAAEYFAPLLAPGAVGTGEDPGAANAAVIARPANVGRIAIWRKCDRGAEERSAHNVGRLERATLLAKTRVAQGGAPRRLLNDGSDSYVPRWSRDGASIYFASDRTGSTEIWKVRDSRIGSVATQVTRHGGGEGFESPDGKYLYYSKLGISPGIWRMPLAGGAEEPIPELQTITHRDWDMVNGGIYFVDARNQPLLRVFRFDTGRVTAVAPLPEVPNPFWRGLAAASDGRSFVIVRYPPDRQEIVLSQR